MPPNAVTPDTWGELLLAAENRSAVRAAERLVAALAKERTRFARPLVFHGPTGCGKSALVRAVVRRVIDSERSRTVQVVPAGELPRDESEIADLRTCDLLIVEDLHHIKPADAETFRVLLDTRSATLKPTVTTALVGPASLPLPRRLTNRLASGLVVRLDPFGLVARTRFAEWYSSRHKLPLSSDAASWLAATADGLRHLAGLIDTLRTAGTVPFGELSAPQVQQLLADPVPPTSVLDRITRTVGHAFRVKAKELVGSSRLRTVLVPRQVAMYLAREVAKLPLTVIGDHFGGRDHTTVLNAVRKIAAAMREDEELAGRVRELWRGLE